MANNSVNYDVNYDDERFTKVESDKNQALAEVDKTYDGMIGQSDKFFQDQIDASKQWADTQTQLQKEQTDFTIEKIEQQKDKAHKDYIKEQSGAYVDWQKQSNQYGVEAERQASAGMDGTGFSESSQVSMYNTYQNRVATAREVYTQAVLNYDNAIKDARLQNNAILAEIAHNALKEQLELGIQGFQYKNSLIIDKANKKIEVDNNYYNRWQDVLNQINTENAMAEEVRQFNKNYDLQSKQLDEEIRQFNKNYDLKLKEFNEGIRQFNEEIARLKKKDAQEYQLEIKNLELKKKQMEEDKRQWEAEMNLKKQQLAATKQKSSGGGSSSKKSSTVKKSSSGSSSSVNKTSSGTSVDTDSIIKLGYGPISASNLANKVATGQVTATQKGDTISFTKNKNSGLAAGQAVLNKYTWRK